MTTTEHTTDFVRVSGIAPIKNEYLILTSAQRHTSDDDAVEQKEETGAKAGGKKGGQKGQNKGRKFGQNKDNIEYCPFLTSSRGCDHGDNCKYTHDAKAYLEKKEPDIGKECVNFRTFGMCNYGLRCRFAGDHTDENGQNVVNEELVKVAPVSATASCLDRDTADKLKKQKYDYTLAKPVIKFLEDELREFQKREKALSESRKAAAAAAWAEAEVSHQTESNGVQPLEQKQEGEISISNDLDDKVVATEATLKNTGEEQQKQEGEISISNNLEDNVVATEATSKIGEETLASNSEAKKRSVVSEDIAANPTKKRREDPENDATEVNTTTAKPEEFLLNDDGKVETYDDGKVAALPAREKKKHIDFRGKTYLAPLTTVGNLPFRRLCKGLGVDITCGEMAMGHQLLAGHKSEWALMKRHASEDIFGVQVCGSKLDIMTKTAELISNHVDCDFVDLNMGCPIDIVFKKGAGSALMDSAGKLGKILRGMNAVLDVPLTIKFRTGVHDNKPTALKLIPRLRDWGCALGTIHGRSRQQRYTKLANWDYITECAEAGKPMPIFGNGDVIRQDEYYDRIEKSGVAGIMMGRGPLIKPWIFTEIKERRDWDITATERLDIMRTFCNYGLEHWGSDTVGVNTTRRYLCEWQSFTHRYVPVGLLEQGIMMNDRPPAFKGRNEMETLLASQDAADWVKISEIFLGKAPDSFKFLPKHKANSYDNPIQG